jgi:hypothetical protein
LSCLLSGLVSIKKLKGSMLMPDFTQSFTHSKIAPVHSNTLAARSDDVVELISILQAFRPNLLLIGDNAELDRVFEHLRPFLRPAIAYWPLGDPPNAATSLNTLVVRDVRHLNDEEQGRVDKLLADLPDLQVVSMAAGPLYPQVQTGAFRDGLFYHLNEVTLNLNAPLVKRP